MLSLLLSVFLTFVEYNCENLFDCQHDSLKEDMQFTPEGMYRWTPGRYWKKLNHISQAILSCAGDSATATIPDMIALTEVENDSVMRDLTKRSLMRNARYEYVMTSSPDVRGIDVALVYSPYSFRLLSSHSIRVRMPEDVRPTRDILYASGLLVSGDTLYIYIVHSPSRSGGEHLTQPYRMLVAERLCTSIDSLRAVCPNARIIVAGDFNDYSDNRSLMRIADNGMIEVSQKATGRNGAKGTYRFQGEWGSLDHIFVSGNMAENLTGCYINDAPFLLEEESKYGGVRPMRSFRGPVYINGYSDHLPLVATFRLE
ncbi:MAG: endonuclease/exonuclease/phosphatase family protein [Prevotella sp.]